MGEETLNLSPKFKLFEFSRLLSWNCAASYTSGHPTSTVDVNKQNRKKIKIVEI